MAEGDRVLQSDGQGLTTRRFLNRFVTGTLNYGVGEILPRIAGFILIPLYTRFLTTEDYGILEVTRSIGGILMVLLGAALPGVVSRFYYDQETRREVQECVSLIFVTVLFLSVTGACVLTFWGEPSFAALVPDVPFSPYLLLIIWGTVLSLAINIVLRLYQVREKSRQHSTFTVARFIVNILLTIALVVGLKQGAIGSLRASFISNIIFCLIGVYILRHDLIPYFDWEKLRASLAYSLPIIPHRLSGWVVVAANRLILAQFETLAIVGIYGVGNKFGSIMLMLVAASNRAWQPLYFALRKEKGSAAKQQVARIVTLYFAALLFVVVAISIYSREVIVLMTTPDFYDSYKVVPVLLVAYLFNGLYFIVVNAIFFAKKTWMVPISTLSSAVVTLFANWLLIPRFGALGTAWATCLSFGVMFTVAWFFSNRLFPIRYEYDKLAKVVVVGVVLWGVAESILVPNLYLSILFKGLLCLLYPVLLLLLGVFSRSEIRVLTEWGRQQIRGLRL